MKVGTCLAREIVGRERESESGVQERESESGVRESEREREWSKREWG